MSVRILMHFLEYDNKMYTKIKPKLCINFFVASGGNQNHLQTQFCKKMWYLPVICKSL